ncbi:hypothetical protein J1N35_029579 [Gossypium stocksii]|uniref:Uncharacterized protein n=1 Tax=Gossypium stocksii TaxID=47602 RepID=A0A9D3UY09_9ROSI|nr:hypothetical protein J1N35_029579 [Gossypium stocksii]
MASRDPHISFAVRGVHHHFRGRCTTVGTPHRRKRGHGPNFEYFPSTATELEVMQAARAYIMHLIEGVLMPDSHGSELGVRSVSHVVSRTLSDDRSFCDGHRPMPHTATVVGTLSDAILGIH